MEHYERADGALQQTDGRGTVRLPADGELHWIVVANQSGYLETNLDGVADSGSVQLQPWGRIEGTLPEPEMSRTNQEIWIGFVTNPHDALMTASSFHVTPGKAGHFILPKIPPSRLNVFVGTKSAVSESRWVWNSSRVVRVDVHPGETTQVTFDEERDPASK